MGHNTKHNWYGSRLYNIYHKIRDRCLNPNYPETRYYMGRGIKICEEWKNSFIAFKDWALANGYTAFKSIDRIDVNGDYSPENCRWATPKQQSRNRRSNINISINGETHCLFEWCEKLDLNYNAILARIERGWDPIKAIETPIKKINFKQKGANIK